MEGVTEFPLRVWFALISNPKIVYTPFLRATKTYPHESIPLTFAPELTELQGKVPYSLRPQVMATSAEDFARVFSYFKGGVEVLDLNAGCPSPTCVGKGAGSSLLSDLTDFDQLISEIIRVLGPNKLSIKIRAGFHSASEFPAILDMLKNHALAHVTVHGRTRPERYLGEASWSLVERATKELACPTIASGDVVDFKSLTKKILMAPKISQVMIGRGALRNPWIFDDLPRAQDTLIPSDLLCEAVKCHALLQELWLASPENLIELVGRDLLMDGAIRDAQYLKEKNDILSMKLNRMSYDPKVKSRVLGRTKMLWNYLRSSLPPELFSPKLLRERDLESLLFGISQLTKQLPLVSLNHRADLDWIYAGGKA